MASPHISTASPMANGHIATAKGRKSWAERLGNVARAVNENIVREALLDVKELFAGDGKDYLSGPDSVFLLAEDDFHKMDIAGLYIFDAELDPQRVIGQLKGYLENLDKTGEKSFARMKSRIVLNKSLFGRPYFELDPKFSVENHFEQHFLDSTESAESSRTSLGLLCGDLLAQGNDWNLPPWKMYLISNLQLPSGQKGCAMFWKLHHAMADGEGTIRPFVHYLAGLDENGNPRGGEVDVAKFQYQVTGKRGIPGSKPGNLEPADGVQTIADDPMFKALQQFALWLIFGLAIFVMNLFQLAVSGFRKSYWSKNGFIKEKQLGFSNPLPMKKVKRVKNALGCTVNDLMVTCTHSAVLRYAQARNALHDTSFTYLVPTSLRRIGDISMTNQSSGWLLALPAEQDAGKLLKEVNGRMMTFKKSLEPYVYYYGQFLWGLFPWIPRPSTATEIGQAFWKRYGKVLSAITNVPGPSTKLHWAGHAYSQYVAVIPCASHNGLGLAIASYNEGITLGVNMDLDAEAGDGELFKKGDGFVLAGLFEEAFAELCRKADEVEQAKRAK